MYRNFSIVPRHAATYKSMRSEDGSATMMYLPSALDLGSFERPAERQLYGQF